MGRLTGPATCDDDVTAHGPANDAVTNGLTSNDGKYERVHGLIGLTLITDDAAAHATTANDGLTLTHGTATYGPTSDDAANAAVHGSASSTKHVVTHATTAPVPRITSNGPSSSYDGSSTTVVRSLKPICCPRLTSIQMIEIYLI
jgi:hypothetical protein